jgi:DNA-binding NtrC family response regulator
MISKPRILVVDDEKNIRESIRLLLAGSYDLHQAASGKEAIQIVKKHSIDLVLLDVRLPEIDGIEILKIIKGLDDSIEVIMVTAVVMVGKAVEAIRHGAYDYITKPFDINQLTQQVEKVMEKRALLKENLSLRKLLEDDYQFEKIIGKSEEIREVFKTIDAVAKSSSTILISGESGTGKELVARALHNRSPRREKLFVAVNCAAIPENLLESELFGHEKGSFTGAIDRQIGKFEIAQGGTIFLDEIGSLPRSMQGKLLRAIQDKEITRLGGGKPVAVDVRIISATNSDLKAEVKKREFREDLFYRLNVIPIFLPPLRERKEDIPLLANHFLNKYNREFGKKIKGYRKEVLRLLVDYNWPGNVRELENLVERLVVLNKGGTIEVEKLPPEIKGELACIPCNQEPTKIRFFEAVKKFEADFIKRALEKTGGKKGRAAALLGFHRNTLRNLERKLRI